jgi:hypothetical protein
LAHDTKLWEHGPSASIKTDKPREPIANSRSVWRHFSKFPSPRPSPEGKGGIVVSLRKKPTIFPLGKPDRCCSLSFGRGLGGGEFGSDLFWVVDFAIASRASEYAEQSVCRVRKREKVESQLLKIRSSTRTTTSTSTRKFARLATTLTKLIEIADLRSPRQGKFP